MSFRDRVRRPSHGTVVGYTALVVALSGSAYAATGGTFTLGETNKANNVTSLRNTSDGSALKLSTDDGNQANLKVSNDAKIKKLNADKLDGKSRKYYGIRGREGISAQASRTLPFLTTSTTPVAVTGMSVTFNLPESGPNDRDIVALYTAECIGAGAVGDWVEVQIRLDGTVITGSGLAFCGPAATIADVDDGPWVAAATQAIAEDIGPGEHTIEVRAFNNGTSELRLDDMGLSVLATP